MKNILCKLGIHKWYIGKYSNHKGIVTGIFRMCDRCNKRQNLVKPIKYHPIKFIWDKK